MIKSAIVETGIIGLSHFSVIKQIAAESLFVFATLIKRKPLAEENNVPCVLNYKKIPSKF